MLGPLARRTLVNMVDEGPELIHHDNPFMKKLLHIQLLTGRQGAALAPLNGANSRPDPWQNSPHIK